LCCIFFLLIISFLSAGDAQNMVASLAQLLGLADSPDKGALVDLVKAIDEVYTEGTIKIVIYPFPRSKENVITGKVDYHMPINVNPLVPVSKLPYRYISEKIGSFVNLLYSQADKPITLKMINDALASKGA